MTGQRARARRRFVAYKLQVTKVRSQKSEVRSYKLQAQEEAVRRLELRAVAATPRLRLQQRENDGGGLLPGRGVTLQRATCNFFTYSLARSA